MCNATLEQLHRMTTGWAAGLVLLMERLRTSDSAPRDINRFKSEELFDYFAAEIFEKTDRDMQAFLLKTAFLPSISPHAALTLTNRKDAEELLAALSRNHFFTERRSVSNPVYQYHPLFREFLQARARETYSRNEMFDIIRHAAQLLEGAGQAEDAAELYRMSVEWEGLVRLIRAHAGSMASQGRSRPLEEWLKSLPEKILEHDPWLLHWMGVCRMPFNLLEGRRYFEKALALFRKQRDTAGVFLAWSGAVEAIIQEMGDIRRLESWVALFEELVKEYGFPPPAIEAQVTIRIFTALKWRRDDPVFILWNKKALALMDNNEDAGLRMLTGFYLFSCHVWWIGDYETSRHVLEVMRRIANTHRNLPPLVLTLQKPPEALFALLTGAHEQCLTAIAEGLAIANDSGVHIWDALLLMCGAGSCLCAGELARAGQFLDKMASTLEGARLFDRFYYYHKSAWRFMLMHDISRAMTYEKTALELASKTGFEIAEAQAHFAMAHLMRMSGERKSAKEHIRRCRGIGQRMGSTIVEFMAMLSGAAFAFDGCDDKKGLTHLKDAMALGRANDYVYFCWWHPSLMTPLCIKALEAGIEVDYVKGLIGTCNLVPEAPPLHVENWPWPIKIYTLGRFELLKDGKTLQFSGKVQKKPLEMLKALIALGGQDVEEARIADALWPDASGDLARRSFDTTLHRLRKLMGNDEVIQLHDGQLTLDTRHCWVDARAFETMVEHAESMRREAEGERRKSPSGNPKSGMRLDLLEKALALYKGHFLPAYAGTPWALSVRERMRAAFLRLVIAQGLYWEKTRQFNGAVDCYEQGLRMDSLVEEFYQRIMICYAQSGRQAEAANVYHRCKMMLTKSLGFAPSSKTEQIYISLRKNQKQ
jgi:DNA-binding SARP family transcriptional activator